MACLVWYGARQNERLQWSGGPRLTRGEHTGRSSCAPQQTDEPDGRLRRPQVIGEALGRTSEVDIASKTILGGQVVGSINAIYVAVRR